VLFIPRHKNGARYYTDKELSLLVEAKQLFADNLPKSKVKERITFLIHPKQEQQTEIPSNSTAVELVEKPLSNPATVEKTLNTEHNNMKMFLSSLETYKQDFLQEVKEEIRNGLRNDLLEPIKQEIRTSQTEAANAISASIQQSNEEIKEDIGDLTTTIHNNENKKNADYEEIRTNIHRLSKLSKAERKTYSKQWTTSTNSSKEIKTMIEQLSKSNNEINKSVELLQHNDQYIMETLQLEREQFHQEIKEREQTFQDLVQSFRKPAGAIEQKKHWWHIW
ncbi:MAG: hypothetical protein ABF649_18335, partial [Bacillus sp. (in: firmicutes)]